MVVVVVVVLYFVCRYGTADEQYKELVNTNKFRPEKDFKGVDRSKGTQKRTQPVQYERDTSGDGSADPFGLDELISKTNKGKGKSSGGGGAGKK